VPVGVYVHVPFCASRCDYCDFATWTDRAHVIDDYVDACIADVGRWRRVGLPAVDTVFFGGGTPSLLPPGRLEAILAAVPRAAGAEVTVECNPDALSPEQLASFRAAGVTRLSIGVQSFASHVLDALGRTHDPGNVRRAFAWARDAGFEHLNADLIYGTPGESAADWMATLDAVLALAPDHVSCYALTVESGTPLGRMVAAGARSAPDDDTQADRYAAADERLGAAGLSWYEISNWARPGGECRHNVGYWRGADYVAIGCASHGHVRGRRWWNVRTPERYVERITVGDSPEAGGEELGGGARRDEAWALELRTRWGASAAGLEPVALGELTAAGLVEHGGKRVVLTRRGRLLATDVTARLLAGRALALSRLEC